ncbi:MAG: hypothetical protein ACOYL6_09020 [Bacteriovoracaceae bacterium]
MKKMFLVTILSLTLSNVFAAQLIVGEASIAGSKFNCSDVKLEQTQSQAKLDANKKAEEFCDTFSLKAERVSEFKLSSNCLAKRMGVEMVPFLRTQATAAYRCN